MVGDVNKCARHDTPPPPWLNYNIPAKVFRKIYANGILLPKMFWPNVMKNCSCDVEKLSKFEAEGGEFSKRF